MSCNQVFVNQRCSCCPFGVHIGLDFDKYCEALFSNETKQIERKNANSSSNTLENSSVLTSPVNNTFHWCRDLSNGNSSHSSCKNPNSSFGREQKINDSSSDNSLNDAIAKFEDVLRDLQQAWKSKYGVNKNISVNTELDNLHIDSPPASPAASIDSSVQSTINKMVLSQIRDQMALSLKKMHELEDQVRDIPILKQKLILLREEKNRLLRRLENNCEVDENTFSVSRIKQLESSGLITPPLSRRKSLFRTGSEDDDPEDFPIRESLATKTMVSSKNIDLGNADGKKDAYLQTSLTDLGFESVSTNTDNRNSVHVSTLTERPSKNLRKSATHCINIEPVLHQQPIVKRSIGITTSFAPSLPRKNTSMVTDLKSNEVVSLKDLKSAKPRLSCTGTDPVTTKKADAFIQATVKQKTMGTKTETKTFRDNSVLCTTVVGNNLLHKMVQTDKSPTIDKIAQVSERCIFCELRQTETIGVGECSTSVKDVGVMTEKPAVTTPTGLPPLSPKTSSFQSIKVCDKCNDSITTVAKEVVKDKSPSPTMVSKIPRLVQPTNVDNSQKRLIIEEGNNEILVYRNPNIPQGGKHRSNFPNMMTGQQQLAGLRLLDEVCKISESEESESEESNSSDEGTYDLESSTITQVTQKKKIEPSKEVKAALKVLNDSLLKPERSNKSATAKSLQIIEKEWFRISSQRDSSCSAVEDYLDCLETYSKQLLNRVVNLTDVNGNTAMHYAISHSNFDIVSVLLDSKVCDVNKCNKAGYTSIILVSLATVGNETQREVIRRLLQLGDVNLRAKQNGQTALMLASSHGHFTTCKLLIEAGAALNVQDNDGSTALMCAAEHGRTDIIRLLLSHPDCDPNIADNDGSTALSIAMEAGHKDIGLMLYASTNMLSRSSSPYASLRRSQSKAISSALRRTGSFTNAKTQSGSKSYQLAPSPPPRSRHSSASSSSNQKSKFEK